MRETWANKSEGWLGGWMRREGKDLFRNIKEINSKSKLTQRVYV